MHSLSTIDGAASHEPAPDWPDHETASFRYPETGKYVIGTRKGTKNVGVCRTALQ